MWGHTAQHSDGVLSYILLTNFLSLADIWCFAYKGMPQGFNDSRSYLSFVITYFDQLIRISTNRD